MGKVQELQHVSLATTYEIDESFDSDKFIKMRLRVCHDGINPNSSKFEVTDMDKAKDSIKNIPILANVIFDENDEPQFGGHDMVLEDSKVEEGETKLIYKEVPIGLVPETCNHEIKEFDSKNYVFSDCYIWKGYSNYAQDIIERDKDIKLSMEILVDAYSYNAKEKCYNITDYRYQGITFLNKNYGTGMKNALATTGTFKTDNSKEKLIIMMEELKNTLNQYNIDNLGKGGSNVDEAVLTLLNQYNIKPEELSFSIENMSIEDIENKLKEVYGSNSSTQENNSEPEKFIKSFELSHEEIRYALYQLLSPIENEDSEWYFIDQVYDDKFEYENWAGTKIYRQGYKKDGDNVTFEGERIELFQERLTKEEKDALDKMRANYSKLESDFNEYKQNYSTPNDEVTRLQKFESDILADERKEAEDALFEEFKDLDGIVEYEELKKNLADYSVEDASEKCFAIRGKKNSKFSVKQMIKKDKVKIEFSKKNNNEKVGEFDELFDKYLNKNKEEN